MEETHKKMIFEKLDERSVQYLKPLCISTHIDGCLVIRFLIDNGATVNILSSKTLKVLRKNEHELVLMEIAVSSFVGTITSAKGVLPIELIVETRKNT